MITVRNPKASDSEPPKNFSFDSVFSTSVEQKHIYDTCAAGVVESVLNGYNGTIFAYGQVICGFTAPESLQGCVTAAIADSQEIFTGNETKNL